MHSHDRRHKKKLKIRKKQSRLVRKSVMFSNVIVDIAFTCRSFVFSQSSCEVSATLTDVGGVAV